MKAGIQAYQAIENMESMKGRNVDFTVGGVTTLMVNLNQQALQAKTEAHEQQMTSLRSDSNYFVNSNMHSLNRESFLPVFG